MPKPQIDTYFPHAENIRKELDGKIETKLPSHIFYWSIGIFLPVLVTILIMLFEYASKAHEKIDSTNIQFAKLESKINTKIEDHKII